MRLLIHYITYFGLLLMLAFPSRGVTSWRAFDHAAATTYLADASSVNDRAGVAAATIQLQKENRHLKIALIGGGVTVLLMLGALLLWIRHMHKRQIAACREFVLKQREAENSLAEIQSRDQQLTGKALSLARSEEIIRQMHKDISKLLPQTDEETANGLNTVLYMLKTNGDGNELWKDFDKLFNELNDNFITKLIALHPTLSPTEIRISSLIRMNLSNKEISDITRRSVRTIEYTRANIRKKMELKPCDNLTKYLMTI